MKRNRVSNTSKEKKLKLFGVELDPSQFRETDQGTSEESSSSPSSIMSEKPSTGRIVPVGGDSSKKFTCSCCYKVFANSQALGGHQNAHKNERTMQKRLQLQARSYASYMFLDNDKNSENFVNFCGPSLPHLNKEVQISFGSNSMLVKSYVSLQQNKRKFSVTHGSKTNICSRKGLDLQLGLGL